MKNLLFTLITFSSGLCFGQAIDTLEGTISYNRNLCADTIYILKKGVFIDNGYTLTIDPGTIIKGTEGTDSDASYLVISRGAKILANGTPAQPIIFTTVLDDITNTDPDYPAFNNLTATDDGLWGGVIILGNAKISYAGGSEISLEGLPIENPNRFYGGDDNSDNSGVFEYVSIRHGGIHIGEGNEVNALTLGAIGSGTVINHIETIACQDDGIELSGGAVNLNDVISVEAGDDAIDTHLGYSGTIDNFIVINPDDEGLELDGPNGDYTAEHTLINGTVKVTEADGLIDLDNDTWVNVSNVYFFDLESGQDLNLVPDDAASTFSNLETTIPDGESIADYFLDGSDAAVTNVELGAQTVGANICEFTTWTCTDLAGLLTATFVVNPIGCNDPTSSNYCPYAPSSTDCRYDLIYDCAGFTNIEEPEIQLAKVNVYPNPADEQFILEIVSDQFLNSTYSIYDVLGKKMSEGQVLQTTKTIDVSNWERGIYLLKISAGDQVVTVKVVMK
ncbi:MAG: hypothetical protein ACI8ZM_004558 [Crocinitomix sp.]|jgi:hypothetical protein